MSERHDRLRAEGDSMTHGARAEKAVARPRHDRQRQGGVRITSDDVEATSSQATASQIVDPTQHQHQRDEYEPHYEHAQQQEGESQGEA